MTKTYAIKGLMECRLRLPTRLEVRPYVDVHFEGGHISGYGTAPARFTTADPLEQYVIEHSRIFGFNKKIYVLNAESQ